MGPARELACANEWSFSTRPCHSPVWGLLDSSDPQMSFFFLRFKSWSRLSFVWSQPQWQTTASGNSSSSWWHEQIIAVTQISTRRCNFLGIEISFELSSGPVISRHASSAASRVLSTGSLPRSEQEHQLDTQDHRRNTYTYLRRNTLYNYVIHTYDH